MPIGHAHAHAHAHAHVLSVQTPIRISLIEGVVVGCHVGLDDVTRIVALVLAIIFLIVVVVIVGVGARVRVLLRSMVGTLAT
eukprot:15433278-Alexandrium_andersonii.AAC.1